MGSGQADARADATLAIEEEALLYGVTAVFGGGGRGFSELGLGANIGTEYDEAIVKPPGRRTPQSSKERITFDFERHTGGAGDAVRTPPGSKGEVVMDNTRMPPVLSLEERFEKDLDLSRSPTIADATPLESPSSPVSSFHHFHRKGFGSAFEPLTDDGDGGGGRRKPRSSKEKIAFGFERRMGGAGGRVDEDDATGRTSQAEYFQGRRTQAAKQRAEELAESGKSRDELRRHGERVAAMKLRGGVLSRNDRAVVRLVRLLL